MNAAAWCPHCRVRIVEREQAEEFVEIEDIQTGEGSWTIVGVGTCERCGRSFRLVKNRLPIEIATVPCPGCRQVVKYRVTMGSVRVREGEFRFKVTVGCPQCHKVFIFNEIIEVLQQTTGIKVGPLGVELQDGDPN